MLREVVIFVSAAALLVSAVTAYLAAFHGEASAKEVFSTAAAALIGLYAGRALERKLTMSRSGSFQARS